MCEVEVSGLLRASPSWFEVSSEWLKPTRFVSSPFRFDPPRTPSCTANYCSEPLYDLSLALVSSEAALSPLAYTSEPLICSSLSLESITRYANTHL